MDLDTLQSVQSRERQTDSVQSLQSDFYESAAEFVAELRDRRERAAEVADDPFADPEVSRLTDDIETAEQTVEAIYERRVGKIVKMASLAAADMAVDDEGLTDEERDLFETLVAAIESNRGRVMDVLESGGSAGDTPDAGTDDAASDDGGVSAAAAMGDTSPAESNRPGADASEDRPIPPDEPPTGTDTPSSDDPSTGESNETPPTDSIGAAAPATPSAEPESATTDTGDETPGSEDEPPDPAADGGQIARRTVQITDDVGEIFGVDDRTYDLGTGDVVTLPEPNADVLLDGDEADPID
ncbi:MAG: hypothetical protein ABEJ86_00730 [Halococcoides sp.]